MVTIALAACDGQAYPWERDGPAPTATEQRSAPSASAPSETSSGGDAEGPHGGLFVRCAEGLQAEIDPVRDVTRLLTVCAPATGMQRLLEAPLEGALKAGSPPVTFDLAMTQGNCYRLFAVGSPGIDDLSVEVKSARGTVLASDHRTDRIAIVQPDRPFCALRNESATVEVAALSGAGAFALDLAAFSARAAIDGGRDEQ